PPSAEGARSAPPPAHARESSTGDRSRPPSLRGPPAPAFLKRRGCGRAQIPEAGPADCQPRRPGNPAVAGARAQEPPSCPGRAPVHRGPRGEPRERAHADRERARLPGARRRVLTKREQHARYVEPDRTDVAAGAAERARTREFVPAFETAQPRRQHGADWPWIGIAVRVPADVAID